jgi:hypothetical protein
VRANYCSKLFRTYIYSSPRLRASAPPRDTFLVFVLVPKVTAAQRSATANPSSSSVAA